MEKKNKIILIGCIILVCVVTAVMVLVNQDAKKTEEGKRLPDTTKEAVTPFGEFEVTDLDGKKVDKSIFQEADVTMVNVWATFCNPCLEEMPYPVSYTHLRAHETEADLVCRLLLEKKKINTIL